MLQRFFTFLTIILLLAVRVYATDHSTNSEPISLCSTYSEGRVFFNEKKYFEAYKYFLCVLKEAPDDQNYIEAYYYLGRLYDDILIRDYDQALKYYKIYKTKNGANNVEYFIKPIEEINTCINGSIVRFQQGQLTNAIKLLIHAKKIKPFDVRIYNNLAAMYIKIEQFDAAASELEKALTIRQDVGDTYYNFACLYSLKNDTEKALVYFKKGISFFSDQTVEASLKDPDLQNLSETENFKQFIKERMQ